MKKTQRFISFVLALVLIFSCMAVSANAATDPTNYSAYTAPSSSDYAYWNGSSVVKASGTTTSEIKWMQASMNYCKKYKGLVFSAYLDVDGSFGPASKAACIAFQKKYGLTQDGSFGPTTISKMKSVISSGTGSSSTSTSTTTSNYSNYTAPSSSDYAYWDGNKVVKASGTTTSEIKWMQATLNYCIVNKGVIASKLAVDGSFGPASKTACIAFQKKYGLTQDGSFGPATISKMKSIIKTPVDRTSEIYKGVLTNYYESFSLLNASNNTALDTFCFFYSDFKNGATFDIKNQSRWKSMFPNVEFGTVIFEGYEVTPEDLGNIIYGMVGTWLNIKDRTLFQGGGYNACGTKYLSSPEKFYGDSERDHGFIQIGINLAGGSGKMDVDLSLLKYIPSCMLPNG